MIDRKTNFDFNKSISCDLNEHFLFPFDKLILFLEGLSIDSSTFFHKWSNKNTQSIIDKYWKPHTKLDWQWSLTFPFFSLLENYSNTINKPIIIGFSDRSQATFHAVVSLCCCLT